MWLIRGVKPIALHQGGNVEMNQINECYKEQDEAPVLAIRELLIYFILEAKLFSFLVVKKRKIENL